MNNVNYPHVETQQPDVNQLNTETHNPCVNRTLNETHKHIVNQDEDETHVDFVNQKWYETQSCNVNRENGEIQPHIVNLKSKVTIYYQILKTRNMIMNRLWMYEHAEEWRKKRHLPAMILTNNDKLYLDTTFGDLGKQLQGLNGKLREVKKQLEQLGQQTILYVNWLKDVKGMSGFYAGILTAKLMDKDFPSRSHLNMYIGYGTVNGKAFKRMKGQKLNNSPQLRALFWNIEKNLVIAKGQYYQYYLQQKQLYKNKHSDYTPKHIHNMAKRKMGKLFTSHLWEEMFKIKYPNKQVPLPMHYKDTPLQGHEYIKPFRDKCEP